MTSTAITATSVQAAQLQIQKSPQGVKIQMQAVRKDTVQFGQNTVSREDSMNILLERAYNSLKGVVADAKAALGLPEDAILDTSPDATAGRIADFALNFFDKWLENHELGDNKDSRQQFVDFIGGAVMQGVQEARDILGALNALNPDVDGDIDSTVNIIQQRFDDFLNEIN